MIKISLLPPEIRAAAGSFPSVSLPWRKIGVSGAALLIAGSIGLLLLGRSQTLLLGRLAAEWKGLQPQLSQLDQARASLLALKNRDVLFRSLKQPEARWAPRLNLLSDSLVSNLWFTRLKLQPNVSVENPPAPAAAPREPKEAGKSKPRVRPPQPSSTALLVLEGSAFVAGPEEGASVKRYLERLKGRPEFSRWFRGLDLQSVEHRQIGDEQVSDFTIALYPTGSS
ncbi:MAG: hypothetical protein HYZ93_06660 [Candidatus Omnitrophica bacterium]|nr:hypothetical protein [Candidatus Omnitrophota bacterium]